jgi:hypothetical protein
MLLALEKWDLCNRRLFVAHDSLPLQTREANRLYWRALSDLKISAATVVSQPPDCPGEWQTVTQQIGNLLLQEISGHI